MPKVYIMPSTRKTKKFMAIYPDNTITHFGAKGYEDYTIHKDKERRNRYIDRHEKNEDWSRNAWKTAGFLSRWILWNKPTLKDSMKDVYKRFGIHMKYRDSGVLPPHDE